MRGTVAKRLARQAAMIKASSKKKVKWYKRLIIGKTGSDGKPVYDYRGTVVWSGYRRIYKDLKRSYKRAASRGI